eukprot:366337-Chlamydomonas_euryale.AAC.3
MAFPAGPHFRAFLTFEGVGSAFYVWLNGHYAGFSKDSRLPAEFEVTSLLQDGANTVAVQVWMCGAGPTACKTSPCCTCWLREGCAVASD